jgi:hypothetical protein
MASSAEYSNFELSVLVLNPGGDSMSHLLKKSIIPHPLFMNLPVNSYYFLKQR